MGDDLLSDLPREYFIFGFSFSLCLCPRFIHFVFSFPLPFVISFCYISSAIAWFLFHCTYPPFGEFSQSNLVFWWTLAIVSIYSLEYLHVSSFHISIFSVSVLLTLLHLHLSLLPYPSCLSLAMTSKEKVYTSSKFIFWSFFPLSLPIRLFVSCDSSVL